MPSCPKCAGFVYSDCGSIRCLNCGWAPPITPDTSKPVLADLRCALCLRDRERGSEWCRQCGVKQKKKLPDPRYLKTECVNGHPYIPENMRFYFYNGRKERRCRLCDVANAQGHRDRKKGQVTA